MVWKWFELLVVQCFWKFGGAQPRPTLYICHNKIMTRPPALTYYYRSRIKCPPFVPKTQTPRVTSKSPHTILKKQKIWRTFLFLIFSMVWGQFLTMPHTFELDFGHEKQTFYSATVIRTTSSIFNPRLLDGISSDVRSQFHCILSILPAPAVTSARHFPFSALS